MTSTHLFRAILALAALSLVPVVWWSTRVTDWVPEIFDVYTFNRFVFNLVVTALLLATAYMLLGRKTSRHKLLSVLTTFISVGICVLLLELPALLFGFNYQKVFATGGDTEILSEGVNKPDPVLIQIHWPNSSFSGEVFHNLAQLGIPQPKAYHVDVSYDKNGFRNDRDYEQADIAVIGDSFIEAAIIPLEDGVVKQLEKGSGVSVVNLGQIAYGLKQELEVLKRYALPLSPKLVIWALFGGNDLRDINTYEEMLEDFGKPPAPVPLEHRLFTRNLFVAGSGLLQRALRTRPADKAFNRSAMFTRADGVTERVYFGQTNRPVEDYQWQTTTQTLSEANRLSGEAGAQFMVVYIPRKFRVYREHLQFTPGTEIAEWDTNELPSMLATWCNDNKIEFLDTTPFLEKEVAAGVHPYFFDDVHWNALGHRLAAREILAHLKRNGIFPFESDNLAEDSAHP